MSDNDKVAGITDPTRKDAGQPDNSINILISLNPATKCIAIQENAGDPILFYGILEQARLLYAAKQAERNKSASIAVPSRRLHLAGHGPNGG